MLLRVPRTLKNGISSSGLVSKRFLRAPRIPKTEEEIELEICCGLNEAGRGAVLGPQIITALTMTRDNMEKLNEMKLPHRRTLKTKQERNEMYDLIMGHATELKTKVYEAREIDEMMFEKRMNWNKVIKNTMLHMINELATSPYEVYVDHDDINVKKHVANLIGEFPTVKWTARHRADRKLPIVAYSDLLAFVERERAMEIWEETIGQPLGSGYGNCEISQEFLEKSLEAGSFNLPVTRVVNIQAQKKSRAFWKQGGRIPLPAHYSVGQTRGHGDAYLTGEDIYAQHCKMKNRIREKMLARQELTADDVDLYKSQYIIEPETEEEKLAERDLEDVQFDDEEAAVDSDDDGSTGSDNDDGFI